MEEFFLTPALLADRWRVTPKTLGQWRWRGRGPNYYEFGKVILYWLPDIEDWETCYPCPQTFPGLPLVPETPRMGTKSLPLKQHRPQKAFLSRRRA